jgi:hypothetical protein
MASVDVQAAGQDAAHLESGEIRIARIDVAGDVVGDELETAALAVEQLRAAYDEAVGWPSGVADAVRQTDVSGPRVHHPPCCELVGDAAGLRVQRRGEPPAYRCPAVVGHCQVRNDLGRQPQPSTRRFDIVVQVELADDETGFPALR